MNNHFIFYYFSLPVGLLALLLFVPLLLELLLPFEVPLLLLFVEELLLPILDGVFDVGVLGVVGVEKVL